MKLWRKRPVARFAGEFGRKTLIVKPRDEGCSPSGAPFNAKDLE